MTSKDLIAHLQMLSENEPGFSSADLLFCNISFGIDRENYSRPTLVNVILDFDSSIIPVHDPSECWTLRTNISKSKYVQYETK